MPDGRLVIDASAVVALLVGSPISVSVADRLRRSELHAPAHIDAEVLSALGRLERGGHLREPQVRGRLRRLVDSPLERHLLPPLITGAWRRRHNLRLVDALYIELASQLGTVVVTTDAGMAMASDHAELIRG